MHRKVANGLGRVILELGAGTLNHIEYENSTDIYDAVEPFEFLYGESDKLAYIRSIYRSITDVPLENTYDRIISVAVLEHIEDLPFEIAHCCLRLNPNGIFQAGIPSEGGLLWWIGWRCTTGVSYWLRNRLDYGAVMRHEHLSTAPEIISIVQFFFDDVEVERFPFPGNNLSLYAYIKARNPRMEIASNFVSQH